MHFRLHRFVISRYSSSGSARTRSGGAAVGRASVVMRGPLETSHAETILKSGANVSLSPRTKMRSICLTMFWPG